MGLASKSHLTYSLPQAHSRVKLARGCPAAIWCMGQIISWRRHLPALPMCPQRTSHKALEDTGPTGQGALEISPSAEGTGDEHRALTRGSVLAFFHEKNKCHTGALIGSHAVGVPLQQRFGDPGVHVPFTEAESHAHPEKAKSLSQPLNRARARSTSRGLPFLEYLLNVRPSTWGIPYATV